MNCPKFSIPAQATGLHRVNPQARHKGLCRRVDRGLQDRGRSPRPERLGLARGRRRRAASHDIAIRQTSRSVTEARSMSMEDNKAIVRGFLEALDQQSFDALREHPGLYATVGVRHVQSPDCVVRARLVSSTDGVGSNSGIARRARRFKPSSLSGGSPLRRDARTLHVNAASGQPTRI
jgi:hypothetical protein